jgi:hypothetical protein
MTSILKIVGFRTGVEKFTAINILRMELLSDLRECKMLIDNVFIGKDVRFEINDDEKIRRVAKELHKVGFKIKIET